MNRQLKTTVHLLRHFGPGWLMYRAGYALRKRSGVLRRALPATSWDAQPLSRFLSDPSLADAETYAAHRAGQGVPFLFAPADRPTFRRFFDEWDSRRRHSVSSTATQPASAKSQSTGHSNMNDDSRHRERASFSAQTPGVSMTVPRSFKKRPEHDPFPEQPIETPGVLAHSRPVSEAGRSPVAMADRLCDGVFRFFEHQEINLGCPPNWHLHPVTGGEYPVDRHWSEIGDFAAGDIKYVWEPSRFAWAYPLVRAYWRTGDERYSRLFWELVDDWRTMNPPQRGVNWKCGQEIALRVMACCFGLYGFADSPETTAERTGRLAQMMAVSGERIEANLGYALSQQNNHGISEATGLWTLGLLFPEFAAAERWTQTGRGALEDQCRKLIDDDGAFSQHSVNYQRVMLHACLWAIRLGELHGRPLSDALRERVCRAGAFLWQLQDESTGRLPRYGANDGALVLPLTNCDHQDYRPVVQATGWLRNGKRRFGGGPWDEELLWLFGPHALTADVDVEQRRDWQAEQGGYCVLRCERGHVLTRAGSYRHRPAHADMLHVDLWWRGQNIALDPGTYTYNGLPPWDSPLARTALHNTVTVDGRDQMDRVGRFLWLPWLSGRQSPLITSPNGQLSYWEGTHDGYQRLPSPVAYRRGVLRIGDEHWLVVDSLCSARPHAYCLHWLLLDAPYVLDEEWRHLRLHTDAGLYDVCIASTAQSSISSLRAEQDGPRGWFAPYYGVKRPALSLACDADEHSVTFWTLLGPSIVDVHSDGDELHAVTSGWECRLQQKPADEASGRLFGRVKATGGLTDELHLAAAHIHPTS